MMSTPSTVRLLTIVSIILIALSILWGMLTVAPILVVETKYQYQKLLQSVFGVENMRQLILPSFAFMNFRGTSQYPEYGIYIPAIFLDERVIFNVDPNNKDTYSAALKQGIAHASGTAFPDNGGVGYYFAHSSSPEFASQLNAVFYLLGKLKVGDEIFITHEGEAYQYQVTQTQVTKPSDVSFLHGEYAVETIVLQTCWPPGTTNERLLVFAERTPTL